MKGRKCSLIFMRKVASRLAVLEERYKDLPPKERAGKINKQLLSEFCVARSEIFNWKQAVKVMEKSKSISPINWTEDVIQPTHAMEIARLPEEKQEEAIEKVQKEKLTVRETKQLVNEQLGKNKPLPVGDFDIIYADPPWQYDVNFLSASPDAHYSTMKTEEICNMVIPSADDAILFLWATNPLLKDALRVMESWGFNYKTNIVWIKDKIGLGFYLRGQHELLLIGVKGKVSPPEESRRVSSVLIAPSNGHSVKPEAAYRLIEQMYPNAHYLELFARNKREGWTSWGNEA